MKLDKKLKEKIDKYFQNIAPNELYRILVKKYKFKEKNNIMDKEAVIKSIKALYQVYHAAAISHAYVMNDMLDNAMYDYNIQDEEDLIKFIENNIK